MPWQTPDTFTSGQILTAAAMNEISNDLTVLRGDFALYRYTSGNITLTGTTTWSTLTTISTAGDMVLSASAGDLVEVAISVLCNSDAVDLGFDAVTVVGGVVTNSFGANGAAPSAYTNLNSISAWYNHNGRIEKASGSAFYKLVSGDISSNTVTIRIRYAMNAATNRQIFAGASNPI
jgi:hypothetical protein